MKKIAAIAATAVLALPASASAYVLKHPKHEHCRHGYVRKTTHAHGRRVITCVRPAKPKPALAPAPPPVSTPVAPPIQGTPAVPAAPSESTEEREAREAREYGINPEEHNPACTPQLEAERVPCEEV